MVRSLISDPRAIKDATAILQFRKYRALQRDQRMLRVSCSLTPFDSGTKQRADLGQGFNQTVPGDLKSGAEFEFR